MRNHRGGVIQAIPSTVRPGVCCKCRRERTLCANVVFRGQDRPCVLCSVCRIATEGSWVPVEPMRESAPLPDDLPFVRRLGLGLRARSPSKHSMPFTF